MGIADLIITIFILLFSFLGICVIFYLCIQLRRLSKQKKIIEEIENVFDEFANLLCEDDGFTRSDNYYIYIDNMNNISMLLEDLLNSYEKYV